jgi:hypothetical protein
MRNRAWRVSDFSRGLGVTLSTATPVDSIVQVPAPVAHTKLGPVTISGDCSCRGREKCCMVSVFGTSVGPYCYQSEDCGGFPLIPGV